MSHNCDNCHSSITSAQTGADVMEEWTGPRGSGVSKTPRVFCGEECERQHRAEWQRRMDVEIRGGGVKRDTTSNG